MANFNKVILAGNLTRDPELRYTPKGTAVARITLAVNRTWKSESGENKEEVSFVDVDVWGRQAEAIAQYMKKGRPLLVEGRLQYRTPGKTRTPSKNRASWRSCSKAFRSLTRIAATAAAAVLPRLRVRVRRQPPRRPRPKAAKPTPPRKETTFPFNCPVREMFHLSTSTLNSQPFSYAKTEVILTHNIVGLGAESDQVKVAAGYARNYLFPQRLAIPLTMANKRQIESLRQRRAEREAHEFNTMTELAKGVAKLICIIKVKAGEDGKMFGSVTAGMIADELKHQFDITLDKRKIHLEHPIRALGDHEVELHLHAEVKGTLKVRVESLTPVIAPAPGAAPADEKSDEGKKHRTEKRSHGRRDAEGEKAEQPEAAEARPKPEKHGEKHAKAEKAEAVEAKPKGEKHVKAEKVEKAEKAPKAPKAEKKEKKAE